MTITKAVKYPWGEHIIYYDSFIGKIVNETTNETLWEKSFYSNMEMVNLDIIFNVLKIGHDEKEMGFKQYNDDCFEYTIFVKKGEDTEKQKILVYRIGFLKDNQKDE